MSRVVRGGAVLLLLVVFAGCELDPADGALDDGLTGVEYESEQFAQEAYSQTASQVAARIRTQGEALARLQEQAAETKIAELEQENAELRQANETLLGDLRSLRGALANQQQLKAQLAGLERDVYLQQAALLDLESQFGQVADQNRLLRQELELKDKLIEALAGQVKLQNQVIALLGGGGTPGGSVGPGGGPVQVRTCDRDAGFAACEKYLGSKYRVACAKLVKEYCLSPEVIKACDDALKGDKEDLDCMMVAAPAGLSAQTITQCDEAMESDPRDFQCVENATLGPIAEGAVSACADAMDGDPNELTCVARVAESGLAPDLIRACGEALDQDPNKFTCLTHATTGAISAQMIADCDRYFDRDPNEMSCIEIVTTRRLDAATIGFCERTGNGDAEELKCLREI